MLAATVATFGDSARITGVCTGRAFAARAAHLTYGAMRVSLTRVVSNGPLGPDGAQPLVSMAVAALSGLAHQLPVTSQVISPPVGFAA